MIKKILLFLAVVFIGIPVLMGIYDTLTETPEMAIKRLNTSIEATGDLKQIYEYRVEIASLLPEDEEEKGKLLKSKDDYKRILIDKLAQGNKEYLYAKLSDLYPDNKDYQQGLKQAVSDEKERSLEEEQKKTAEKERESKKWEYIFLAKEAVKLRLKDPESASFRNIVLPRNSSNAACGEFNSKNSLGGYGGFSKFVSTGSILTVLESDGELFIKSWNSFCFDDS